MHLPYPHSLLSAGLSELVEEGDVIVGPPSRRWEIDEDEEDEHGSVVCIF